MRRRAFNSLMAATAGSLIVNCGGYAQSESGRYQPTWDSVERHVVPDWFQDAKFGIFIHWGLYSVPAWATPTGELGKVSPNEWFKNNPYAEWYLNSLRIADSPTHRHHSATYGKNFDYYQFTQAFNKDSQAWRPGDWAELFKRTGARYVVLTSKHHDGFRLWPSNVENPHAKGRQLSAKRDIVGDLTGAVRAAGLHMGLYYSGGLDWTFTSEPIRNSQELRARVPQSEEYASYADAQWHELMDRYKPSVMWNDINYPRAGQIARLFADYYNSVPDGVINDRFGVPFADFTTPEYAKYDKITLEKWETCRGLGFSFGYNQVEGPEQVIHPQELVALLVDIVSKNGNLLLNVGPKPDGTISDIQLDRLHKLGDWLEVNGEAIYGSRPWVRPSASGSDGSKISFTCNNGALYAIFLSSAKQGSFRIPSARAVQDTKAQMLGGSGELKLAQEGSDIVVSSETALPQSLAATVKLTPAPQSLV